MVATAGLCPLLGPLGWGPPAAESPGTRGHCGRGGNAALCERTGATPRELCKGQFRTPSPPRGELVTGVESRPPTPGSRPRPGLFYLLCPHPAQPLPPARPPPHATGGGPANCSDAPGRRIVSHLGTETPLVARPHYGKAPSDTICGPWTRRRDRFRAVSWGRGGGATVRNIVCSSAPRGRGEGAEGGGRGWDAGSSLGLRALSLICIGAPR